MTIAKKFYVSSYYHIRVIQTWKQNLFVRFFVSDFFLDTYVSPVIDIFEPFRNQWILFQATQSFNWHFEHCFSVIVFTKFFLCYYYVPSKKSASKRFFFAKEILILYFNFILPFYQLNIHNNLLIFGAIHLFLQYF